MTKSVAYCLIIAVVLVVTVLVIAAPELLSDKNAFLKDFVGTGLLSFLGVVVTITLASAAQLHLSFNRIEERYNVRDALKDTRKTVKDGAYWLLKLLLIAIVLVVAKPVLPVIDWVHAAANGIAVIILFVSVLILVDLTQLVFSIESEVEED